MLQTSAREAESGTPDTTLCTNIGRNHSSTSLAFRYHPVKPRSGSMGTLRGWSDGRRRSLNLSRAANLLPSKLLSQTSLKNQQGIGCLSPITHKRFQNSKSGPCDSAGVAPRALGLAGMVA